MSEDINTYVREHSQPTPLDVGVAKRVFFDQVHDATDPSTGLIDVSGLLSRMERVLFQVPGPFPSPYERAEPDLNELKAHIATRESVCYFHAMGLLVSFGRTPEQAEERRVIFYGSSEFVVG